MYTSLFFAFAYYENDIIFLLSIDFIEWIGLTKENWCCKSKYTVIYVIVPVNETISVFSGNLDNQFSLRVDFW